MDSKAVVTNRFMAGIYGQAVAQESMTGIRGREASGKEQEMRFNIADFLQMLVDWLLSEGARIVKAIRNHTFHQEA